MDFVLNVLTVFLTLFAVIDMPGNVPLVIRLRKENGEIETAKSTIVATVIMVSILFIGDIIFKLLGLQVFHFALAGAMLLLYFGVRMVLGIESETSSEPMPPLMRTIATLQSPDSGSIKFNEVEVGVDPYNKLIDTNSENNRKKIISK
jgi:multiple antibiotic resistance protein